MGDRTLATRAAELGAVAVVQPGFVEHVGRNARGFEPDDATWLPFATLVGAGVVLAGSSDDPCGPLAPLDCARLGVHRHSDGHPFGVAESVPVDMWLAAYTRGAAFAGGQEHERGTITAGKVGDFVVLDLGEAAEDPVVAETWVGGRPVYRRRAAAGPIC
jgi:predicted amidohydrolase YtcJ